MLTKFATVSPGHIDLPDHGQNATPANDRRFTNRELAGVFGKAERIARVMDQGGWDAAGVPTLDHYMETVAWYAGPPEGLVAYLKELEARYPGMEHINLSTPMATPEAVMLEQFQWVSEAVMPHFSKARAKIVA